jgi:hypothetical protein
MFDLLLLILCINVQILGDGVLFTNVCLEGGCDVGLSCDGSDWEGEEVCWICRSCRMEEQQI